MDGISLSNSSGQFQVEAFHFRRSRVELNALVDQRLTALRALARKETTKADSPRPCPCLDCSDIPQARRNRRHSVRQMAGLLRRALGSVESPRRIVSSTLRDRPPVAVRDKLTPVQGWRACYGTGTNNWEVSRESSRDQSGRRRCAVQRHVRAGSDHAHEQSRGRSE